MKDIPLLLHSLQMLGTVGRAGLRIRMQAGLTGPPGYILRAPDFFLQQQHSVMWHLKG